VREKGHAIPFAILATPRDVYRLSEFSGRHAPELRGCQAGLRRALTLSIEMGPEIR
jgi:hypothetical protein